MNSVTNIHTDNDSLLQTTYSQSRIEGGLRTKKIYNKPTNNIPIISIITVVYNGDKYIEKTIQSIIKQSYENLEYIIIDGGSTDKTLDIIQKYDEHIDYWLSEADSGIYDAMNKGWSKANNSSFILFLGAGDEAISLPKVEELLDPNTIIYGVVSLGNNILFKSEVNFKLRFRNTIHHQALLIHKSLSINPPFDTRYIAYADFDFNVRLWLQNIPFKFSDSFVSYALPGGISSKVYTYTRESLRIIMTNFGVYWAFIVTVYYFYALILRYPFNKK